MIKLTQKGDLKRTKDFLNTITFGSYMTKVLKKYGEKGVNALAAATPVRTGATASSWNYEIKKTPSGYSIEWNNSNVVHGVNIALILQTGHATGTGGYVKGIDYVNPALKPIFDDILDELWEEVTNA